MWVTRWVTVCPPRASRPTSIPRGSLPSSSSTCSYGVQSTSRSRVSENMSSTGRDSASTTPRTSAATSRITIAVWVPESSVTGSVVSSTQPTQSPRPLATTSVVPSRRRVSSWPRTLRRIANSLWSDRSRPSTANSSRITARVAASYSRRSKRAVTRACAAITGAPRGQSLLLSARGRSNMFSTLKAASRVVMDSMPPSIADLECPDERGSLPHAPNRADPRA